MSGTMLDLARALVAAPWWEWRVYTPVVESGQSGMTGCRGVVLPSVVRPGHLCVRWAGPPLGPKEWMETGITHGTVIDFDHPGAAGVLVGMLAATGRLNAIGAPNDGETTWDVQLRDPPSWTTFSGDTLAEAAGRALLACRS